MTKAVQVLTWRESRFSHKTHYCIVANGFYCVRPARGQSGWALVYYPDVWTNGESCREKLGVHPTEAAAMAAAVSHGA